MFTSPCSVDLVEGKMAPLDRTENLVTTGGVGAFSSNFYISVDGQCKSLTFKERCLRVFAN